MVENHATLIGLDQEIDSTADPLIVDGAEDRDLSAPSSLRPAFGDEVVKPVACLQHRCFLQGASDAPSVQSVLSHGEALFSGSRRSVGSQEAMHSLAKEPHVGTAGQRQTTADINWPLGA